MARRDEFYGRRTEPDMRQELINFLDGNFPEIPKKEIALLRKMRRTADGKLVPCDCVDSTTTEPDKDTFCPICHGEGHKWDEEFIEIYKVLVKSDVGNAAIERLVEPGLVLVNLAVFYIKYDVPITDDDKIVTMVLDLEGGLVKPYRRRQLWRVGTPIDLRSDTGRLEFWKLNAFAEKRKFLNG